MGKRTGPLAFAPARHARSSHFGPPRRRAAIAIACAALLGCSDSSDGGSRRPGRSSAPGAGTAGNNGFGNAPVGGEQMSGAGQGALGGSAALPGDRCAQGAANTAPVTPTVWLVLDGSSSMNEDFGGPSRWEALRSALMDPGGVVTTLEQNVRFGMVLYSGNDQDDDDGAAPAECVALSTVEPALNNYAALDAQLPEQEPGGWTPTDRALEHVVGTLPVANEQMLDARSDPIYVVLATDGAPNDRCSGDSRGGRRGSGFDPEVAQRVLDAVGRGVEMGMHLLVISLAGDDEDLQMHLEEVTALSGTGQPPFVPATRDDLVATLQQIIGGASCQIALDGRVAAGQECLGTVTLNDVQLACNDPNGFRLVDERTVQLQGTACDRFLAMDSELQASFPCGAFTPD